MRHHLTFRGGGHGLAKFLIEFLESFKISIAQGIREANKVFFIIDEADWYMGTSRAAKTKAHHEIELGFKHPWLKGG